MKARCLIVLALFPALSALSQTGNDVDHTIARTWTEGGSLDMKTFLSGESMEVLQFIKIVADGRELENGVLPLGDEPDDCEPNVFLVEIQRREDSVPLDKTWVVVNSPETERLFSEWCTNNASTAWAASLPKPYTKLTIGVDAAGVKTAVDPEPGSPGEWSPPRPLNTHLHHGAAYEMRTEVGVAGEHGHQATYDENGSLIRVGIAAGTADFKRPYTTVFWTKVPNFARHLEADVLPYIRALQLDGNPVKAVDVYRNLDRPCLFMGEHTLAYLLRRPTTPSGTK